jgi:serpin B
MKNDKLLIVFGIILMIWGGLVVFGRDNKEDKEDPVKINANLNNEFYLDMVKVVNERETGNYLISPYSIEIALNMLKEGAEGDTYKEIDKVVGKRNIPYFEVKDRISVANALFIKDSEKDNISKDYINKLQTSYRSDLIYDVFDTPDKINNWVNEKTYKMIPKILDDMSKDFVLGLANALAIDVEWRMPFDCSKTNKSDFTTSNGTKKVEMMNNTYGDISYILSDNEEGIIIPYMSYKSNGEKDYDNTSDSTTLEFIAIKPKNIDIRTYINNLNNEVLNNIIDSKKKTNENEEVILKLPRFEYDYSDDYFMDDLESLGIKSVFDPNLANLSKMKNKDCDDDYYVNEAIHMTHISLNEKGTKAAAVTYFGLNKASISMDEIKYINIEFNKPFMYMIRDTKTKEILFFGVVESPNEWKGNTCSE